MGGAEIGNYRILEKLGEGRMGVVYKAVDVKLDRTVAMKALKTDLSGHPELEELIRAQFKQLSNLNHANLASLYAVLIENGRPWVVMEYVKGETFEQMVKRRGPIPSDEAIALFRQALSGVGYGHQMGLAHRDIKPSNIMLNQHGVVKVMDLGLAKALSTRGVARTGSRLGNSLYMSPEQFLNRPVDFRSDTYSLGIIAYEMLTGKAPFSADSDYQIMSDHVNSPPPLLTSVFPYVPKGLERAVLKALEKNPEARYQSVEEFSAALENTQGFAPASPVLKVRPESARPASGNVGTVLSNTATVPPKELKLAAKRGFFTRERRVIAAALASILALAGFLLAVSPGARQFVMARFGHASAPAPSADATPAPPVQPDNGTIPANQAQPGAPAEAVAGAPVPATAVPADGVAVVPGQPDAPADSGAPTGPLVIPAGTVVAVRLSDPVDSSMNQVGDTFAATVDRAVNVDGTEAIPSGADATLKLISLALAPVAVQTDVQVQLSNLSINGTDYTPRSSVFEQQSIARTKKNAAKIIGSAAVGATIGGIFGRGKGAAAGAAKQFIVVIPANTRIKFTLRHSITLGQ